MPRMRGVRRALGRARSWPSVRLPRGAGGRSGWPGETRSPSSTSHSTIWPPWAAVTLVRSRRLATSPIGGAGGEHVGVGGLRRRCGRCPWRGRRPSARSAWCRCSDDLAVLVAERAGVVELVGRLEREGLDALERALGDAGQGAGRRHLEDAGDAEVVHRLHAQVPADRAGDLADDPGAARRGRRGRPGRRGWR